MTTLLIALAGGLGAASRLAVDGSVSTRTPPGFPWATALINITGSFLLGLIVGLAPSETWHAALGTGFLGGYTTFSTASFETARLALDRRHGAAAVNAFAMLAISVAAASLGYALGHAF